VGESCGDTATDTAACPGYDGDLGGNRAGQILASRAAGEAKKCVDICNLSIAYGIYW